MAKTAVPPALQDGLLTGVAAKATAAAQRAAGLRADLKAAKEIAHQAQVREALSRTELTLALTEALRARAQAQAQVRRQAMQRYLGTAGPRPLRQRGRPTRTLEKLLLRLKGPGQAEVIRRAGVWRDNDPVTIDAYVRRGADPLAVAASLFDQAW
ncbi:MAG: hypothetical protein ACREEG_08540, partial [Phenylobacterium sp.]